MAPNLHLGAAGVLAALPGRLLASVTARLPITLPMQARPRTAALVQQQQPTLFSSSFLLRQSTVVPQRPFSTTPTTQAPPQKGKAGGGGGGGGKKAGGSSSRRRRLAGMDPKVRVLDRALYKNKFVAPPLRMGRNRFLRHWTIHRAWLLFRRQARETRERELMQQYQSMRNACEELRLSRGPGLQDDGYLFRVAMEKKGVWRHGGVPIEYARPQTDTPAHVPWNHDWQR